MTEHKFTIGSPPPVVKAYYIQDQSRCHVIEFPKGFALKDGQTLTIDKTETHGDRCESVVVNSVIVEEHTTPGQRAQFHFDVMNLTGKMPWSIKE